MKICHVAIPVDNFGELPNKEILNIAYNNLREEASKCKYSNSYEYSEYIEYECENKIFTCFVISIGEDSGPNIIQVSGKILRRLKYEP